MEALLNKAVAIKIKYSLKEPHQGITLREFSEDLAFLTTTRHSLKGTEYEEIYSEISSSITRVFEEGLGLVRLFEQTQSLLPQIQRQRVLDQEYLRLIAAGDGDNVSKLVESVAKENDHKHTVFRGDDQPYSDYTESLKRLWEHKSCGGALGRGLYFASTRRYADVFGEKARYRGVTRMFFIKANPVDLDALGVVDFINEYQAPYLDEIKRREQEADKFRKIKRPDGTKHPVVADYDEYVDKLQNQVFAAIKEKFGGDSVCVENYGLFARPGEYEYNIQNPKFVKLADPIVRDDNGEIMPLSRRFDTNSSDVRGLTQAVLLAMPIGEGLRYLAKDTYEEGLGFSNWVDKLFDSALHMTQPHHSLGGVEITSLEPTKEVIKEPTPRRIRTSELEPCL